MKELLKLDEFFYLFARYDNLWCNERILTFFSLNNISYMWICWS